MRKRSVLFLCTGNSCRTQMAEALLRHRFGEWFDVYSAGTSPKGVHPMTLEVLEERGIDITPLRSKDVAEYLGKLSAHYVIVVCGNADASCPRIWPGMVERLFWPFDDPASHQGSDEAKLERFREVRDQIDRQITAWVTELKQRGELSSLAGASL